MDAKPKFLVQVRSRLRTKHYSYPQLAAIPRVDPATHSGLWKAPSRDVSAPAGEAPHVGIASLS